MSGFTINVTYDSSITALAASNPTLYADYTGAITQAVNFYEAIITNPITVNIDFGWGEVNGITGIGLGESETYFSSLSYTALRGAMLAADTTSAVQIAAAATLPLTDPTGGAGNWYISTAEAKALNLYSGSGVDGYVGISSSQSYSWTAGTTAAGTYNAVSVLEHEISEVMGRQDTGGGAVFDKKPDYTPLDLFRYTAANGQSGDAMGAAAGARDEPFVSGYSAAAYSYFSYNGSSVTQEYDLPSTGGDIADWASTAGNDAYDGFATPGVTDVVSTTDLQELNVLGYELSCFLAGTSIAVPGGNCPVERLAIGDLVTTHDGRSCPILWVGRQSVAMRFADPRRVLPIRIKAGALGEGLPRRDLLLSRDHALLLDGVLVQAGALVNGDSIAPAPAPAPVFTYYHVELNEHALLLANGVAAETFIDHAGRMAFENWREYAALYPAGRHIEELAYPRAKAARQLPPALHARLAALAGRRAA